MVIIPITLYDEDLTLEMTVLLEPLVHDNRLRIEPLTLLTERGFCNFAEVYGHNLRP